MSEYYQKPLASIHDHGFLQYSESAAELINHALAQRGISSGHVIDLGCGTGRLLEIVAAAGHRITGLDISQGMIEIAAQRVPAATFVNASWRDFEFPDCDAVAAVGEIFNYQFDQDIDDRDQVEVFARIFDSLGTGGVFMFDVATPGRLGGSPTRLQHFETPAWSMVVDSIEQENRLRRRCLMYVRNGDDWRRHEEIHWLRLVDQNEIVDQLQSCGFEVQLSDRYGSVELPSGMFRISAQKP